MQKLYIEDYKGNVRIVPMEQDDITIGREKNNAICFPEKHISRNHARILKENGKYFIADIQSRYGIKVNGVKIIEKIQIKPGDLISVGDYTLKLMTVDSALVDAPCSLPQTPPLPEEAEEQSPNEKQTAIITLKDMEKAKSVEVDDRLFSEISEVAEKKPSITTNKIMVVLIVGIAIVLVGVYIWVTRESEESRELSEHKIAQKKESIHESKGIDVPDKTTEHEKIPANVITEEKKNIALLSPKEIEKQQVQTEEKTVKEETIKTETPPVQKKEDKTTKETLPVEKKKEIPEEKQPKETKLASKESIEPSPTSQKKTMTKEEPKKEIVQKEPKEPPKEQTKEEKGSMTEKDKLQKIQELYKEARKAKLEGDSKKAKSLLHQCISLSPGHADAYKQLGIICAAEGDNKNAVKHYKKYIELKPDAVDASTIRNVIEQLGGN